MYYEMEIAGLKRQLPLCKVTDDLYIAAFIMFSDVEITKACAAELLKKAPEYDVIMTAEAKGIPLCYEMARQAGTDKYVIARKGPTDLAVVPREKPHTGAAAREQPRDSPVIER